jgi:hypothetical protein
MIHRGLFAFLAFSVTLLASACAAPQFPATPTTAASPASTFTSEPAPMNLGVPTRPVDANRDGVIDTKDVLQLMGKANACFDTKIRPLIDKARVQTNGKRRLTAAIAQVLIREKLTLAEQSHLDEAMNQWQLLNAQVDATLKEVLRKK